MTHLPPTVFDIGPAFDPSVPNVARMYDYWLGGKDNYQADRAAAEEVKKVLPDVTRACRQNRMFLGRVVAFLAGKAGIWQFIDIGTGLPTMNNVHEVAQKINHDARVVYVDYDPVVVGHANVLLASDERTVTIHADLRTPRELLVHPEMRTLVDFSQPVAILTFATLHFITDEERPYDIIGTLKDTMTQGSYLAISHATSDDVSAEELVRGTRVYKDASAPLVPRTHADVLKFFDGLELVSPGLVNTSRWRSGGSDKRALLYGGVARKGAPSSPMS